MPEREFPARVRRILAARSPLRMSGPSLRPASVLVPLFANEEDGALGMWLVRRREDMRTHSGQVALPGGQRDPEDVDLLATALRETHEEIGLSPREVTVLGVLDDCVTITGFVITPYVGWIENPFTPSPLAAEIARVFSAPLSAFQREPIPVSLQVGSSKRIVLSYEASGETVWGATATILSRFTCLLEP